MLRSSLLLLAALVALGMCSPSRRNSTKDLQRSLTNWPCPNPVDIDPCECITNANFNLYMDCSAVPSTAKLQTIFAQDFPFLDFNGLVIAPRTPHPNLDSLPAGVFGEVTFENILIYGTHIRVIEEETLVNSHETLLNLDLENNELEDFPFETIPLFVHLHSFILSGNNLGVMDFDFPDIVSNSLTLISLNGNTGLNFKETTFNQCPYLEDLFLQNMGLASLSPNIFSQMHDLHVLDLGLNGLSGELREDLINPGRNSLVFLHLHDNSLTDIHPDAITGLSETAKVNLKGNNIVELKKEKWSPLLQQVTNANAIDLRNNDLVCGCDVYWLVADPDLMKLIHEGTKCSNDVRLHDLPISFFQQHCPGGP